MCWAARGAGLHGLGPDPGAEQVCQACPDGDSVRHVDVLHSSGATDVRRPLELTFINGRKGKGAVMEDVPHSTRFVVCPGNASLYCAVACALLR